MNAPRSTIVSRAVLLRELTTRVAACVDHIRSMDDHAYDHPAAAVGLPKNDIGGPRQNLSFHGLLEGIHRQRA